MALSYGYSEVAVALIQGGVELSGLPNQQPPLLTVVQWGCDPSIFEALLSHGADVSFRHEGKSLREHVIKHRPNQAVAMNQRYLQLLDAVEHNSRSGSREPSE